MGILFQSTRRQRSLRIIPGPGLGHESGSALVELALTLPIFALLLLGAAEFARLTYYAIELANAARAGVQYGAKNHATAADSAGMVTAAKNDAVEIMSGSDVTSTISGAGISYCTCSNGTTVTCANAASICLTPAKIYTFVQLNLSARVSPYIKAPGLPTTYTLTSQATMRVLQ